MITQKLGTTFMARCNRDGKDLTNITIRSSFVHLRENTVHPLTVTKTNPAQGRFTISMTAAQTADLQAGIYQWDILYQDSDGLVVAVPGDESLLVEFIPQVTR